MMYGFFTYQAARGTPVAPNDELAIFGYVAIIVFILSGFAVIRQERSRADASKQAIRNMRREEERRQYHSGVPTGLKVPARTGRV